MKKICYVVTIPSTIRAFFLPQLNYLDDNGFDVSVICSNDDHLQKELGQKVHYLPVDIPRGISLKASIIAVLKLIQIFRKEKFDLVQYSTPNAALCASIASRIVGIKVRNYHLMGYRYLGANGVGRHILKMIEKVTCMLSTNIECVSYSNMELGVAEKILKKEKATVVWNGSTGGVDLERFDINKRAAWRKQIRNELGYADNDFIYGFVGRITRDKGIDELLEAFFQLNDGSKLLLVGDMEAKESLNSELLQRAYTCTKVQFHGSVKDIERYYAAMDVFVFPSYREGFGNAVIEAAALGVPAIVSDIPGPIDTIQKNETAFTCEVKNVCSLIDAMKRIRISDYKSLGKNATRFVKGNFDSEVLNEKILFRKRNLLNVLVNKEEMKNDG